MLTTWLKSNYWMNGKTAFNTHLGHFEYLVIHPLFFQAMVNGVLRDCLNRFVFVLYCLDNILIFSKSLYEHESQICLVLQCLLENELFIKGENCEYHTDSISLFGYIVEWGQVWADLEKIQVVLDWATLITWEHLKHFLGFANFYCQFICNFSKITLPVSNLTSPKVAFQGEDAGGKVFSTFKDLSFRPHPARHITPVHRWGGHLWL